MNSMNYEPQSRFRICRQTSIRWRNYVSWFDMKPRQSVPTPVTAGQLFPSVTAPRHIPLRSCQISGRSVPRSAIPPVRSAHGHSGKCLSVCRSHVWANGMQTVWLRSVWSRMVGEGVGKAVVLEIPEKLSAVKLCYIVNGLDTTDAC